MKSTLWVLAGIGLGALFGLVGAGPIGGLFGAILGAVFASLWSAVRVSTHQPRPGAALHHERHRLLCVPNGQMAEVELLHDGHHWCDVESCTLCSPRDKVQCQKRCLVLMNDNYKPGRTEAVH